MTPAPLPLRAFGHRLLVAFLICVLIVVVMGVAVGRAENAKVDKIRTVAIDPSLLRAGNNYLIVGSDTRSFVKSASDAEHFGSAPLLPAAALERPLRVAALQLTHGNHVGSERHRAARRLRRQRRISNRVLAEIGSAPYFRSIDK